MGMGMDMDSKDMVLLQLLVLIPLKIQVETRNQIQNGVDQTRSLGVQSRSQTSYHFDSCA